MITMLYQERRLFMECSLASLTRSNTFGAGESRTREFSRPEEYIYSYFDKIAEPI